MMQELFKDKVLKRENRSKNNSRAGIKKKQYYGNRLYSYLLEREFLVSLSLKVKESLGWFCVLGWTWG